MSDAAGFAAAKGCKFEKNKSAHTRHEYVSA